VSWTPDPPFAEALTAGRFEGLLLHPMGEPGVFARSGLYEAVAEALGHLIDAARPAGAEVLRFPPVMSREILETSGYLSSFPNLLGCVCCLSAEVGRGSAPAGAPAQPWTEGLKPSGLVLTPASCYPLYPIIAARGASADPLRLFDVGCDCFRAEPSLEADRLQSFRMREFVAIGSAQAVQAFRAGWLETGVDLAASLALPQRLEGASDPFFGRSGALMAAIQLEKHLKFELVIPVRSAAHPTACMSFNYHEDHFGRIWTLCGPEAEPLHTACVAFGMDRLTLALFAHHGPDLSEWPAAVRSRLQL
jgi:seryl-tRNA synthetase